MTVMTKLIVLESLKTTFDGRLRRGQLYAGCVVSTPRGIRILVSVDEKGERTEFDPKCFKVVLSDK